jgi:hypothetical protein
LFVDNKTSIGAVLIRSHEVLLVNIIFNANYSCIFLYPNKQLASMRLAMSNRLGASTAGRAVSSLRPLHTSRPECLRYATRKCEKLYSIVLPLLYICPHVCICPGPGSTVHRPYHATIRPVFKPSTPQSRHHGDVSTQVR